MKTRWRTWSTGRSVGEPLMAELVGVESWEGDKLPTSYASVGPFTGYEALKFAPTITAAPEVS